MRIYSDTSLRNFEFWSRARDNAADLSYEDLDTVESILEDLYPDGIDATDLNDLFCYDFDTVLEWVGKERFGDSDSIVDSDDIEELYPSELIQNYGNDFREAVWDAYTAYMEGTDEEDWAYTNVDDLISDGAEEEGEDEIADVIFNALNEDDNYEIKDEGYTYKVVRVY